MGKSYEGTNELKNQLIVDVQEKTNTVGRTQTQQEILLNARLSRVATGQLGTKQPATLTEEKKEEYMEMHKKHIRQISNIFKSLGTAVVLMAGTFYVASE